MSIHLVPPTLTTIARILNKRIPLHQHFASLREWMSGQWSLDDCDKQGFPRLKYVARGIGQGLGVGCTEDDSGTLLWVAEVSCHPMCIFHGERNCTYLLDILTRVKMAKTSHDNYLRLLGTYATIKSRAISPVERERK